MRSSGFSEPEGCQHSSLLGPPTCNLAPGCLQVVELAACPALTRLDLSKNRLSSLDGVALNTRLRWLSAL